MTKSVQSQNLPADVTHLIDQLERHCLAPDGTYVTKSSSSDLQLAREEMLRERTRYLEAMAVYYEAIAMVEEYQQAVSAENLGGVKDIPDLYRQLGLKCSPQVYDSLEHRLAVAEAAQRLRLPLLSKDGEIHEEEIEKLRMISRSSLDSTSTSITPSSSSNSTSYNNIQMAVAASWEMQDTSEYQSSLVREIESRLEAKCETLADMFTMDDYDFSSISQISSAWLPERLKLIIEEMGRKEAVLLEDLYSMDRKFAEHYNVHNKYVLEHLLLRDTYAKDSVPALYKIRKYLLEATEEASIAYSKAVTRLREYQGVDPHFDTIARQYHDIVKKLEGMQWTIHQVEMDLKRSLDHSST